MVCCILASNAGFITGLSVIFVPLFSTLINKEKPGGGVISGALCAAAGLALISGFGVTEFNVGDLLVLCCAFSFALHIIYVGKFTALYSTVWLVALQIGVVAVCSGFFSLFLESDSNTFQPAVWPALIITALFATSFAFFVQNYMQRFTSPSHTAIILTSEPVFSAVFSVLLLQESLTPYAYWGGALIVLGMLLSEVKTLPWTKTGRRSCRCWVRVTSDKACSRRENKVSVAGKIRNSHAAVPCALGHKMLVHKLEL